MRKLLVPVLLGVLAISLATLGFAFATETGSSSSTSMQDASQNTTTQRHIEVVEEPNMVLVRSDYSSGTTENHFGVALSTDTLNRVGVLLRVAFSHESEIGTSENETNIHMIVAYVNLVEFTDSNNNGIYNPGTDAAVQNVSLASLSYTSPTWTPITSQDGKHGVELAVNGTGSGSTGGLFFGVKADLFPQYAIVGGKPVQPTETKITTTINGFPFKNKTDMVALQVVAMSQYNVDKDSATTDYTLRVRSATAQGFYNWTPNATVDGKTVNVGSSVTKLGKFWVINLAYPNGNNIVHDPLLGFSFGATPLVSGALLVGAAITSLVVFGVLVYAGRHELARIVSPRIRALLA